MKKDEEIRIRIKKEYLDRLKQLGISVQDVFSRGLEETFRSTLRKYATSKEFLDEIDDDDDYDVLVYPEEKLSSILISDNDLDNT
jgi:hypothetical protein